MYKQSLSIGTVFRQAWTCWRQRPFGFVLIACAALVPHTLFGVALKFDPTNVDRDSASLYTLFAWEFTEIAAWGLVEAGFVLAILQALNGQAVRMRNSAHSAAPFALRAVAVDSIVFMPLALFYIYFGTDELLWLAETNLAWVTIVAVAVLLVWLWLAVVTSVAIPALIVERRGIRDSLRRSYALTRGNRWRIFAIVLCVELTSLAFKYILDGGVGAALPQSNDANEFIHWIDHSYFAMVSAIVSIVLYQHLRRLDEGDDSDRVAAIFE